MSQATTHHPHEEFVQLVFLISYRVRVRVNYTLSVTVATEKQVAWSGDSLAAALFATSCMEEHISVNLAYIPTASPYD